MSLKYPATRQAETQSETFHDTDAARERREVRRAVSRLGLSLSEKAALQLLVNVWFAHRHKAGVIYPGREAIAHKTGLSLRTVATFLAKFRDCGFIRAVDYAQGGRKATRYVVSLDAIRDTAWPPIPVAPGTLKAVPTGRASEPDIAPKPCKNCTRSLKEAKATPSRKVGKRKAEIIRPSQFSIWRGTAREAFLSWVSRQEDISPSQERVLSIIGSNLCPDDGRARVSVRFLARESGFTRRDTDRIFRGLIDRKIISVDAKSRMTSEIRAGSLMGEILDAAPGMPF